MRHHNTNLSRLIATSLAAAAIAATVPAGAGAQVSVPDSGGGGGAPEVGVPAPAPAPVAEVTARDLTAPDQVDRVSPVTAPAQNLSAPDQVDRVRVAGGSAPAAPQALSPAPSVAANSSDDGVDPGVLIGIGAAALMVVGGIGLVRRRAQQASLAIGRSR